MNISLNGILWRWPGVALVFIPVLFVSRGNVSGADTNRYYNVINVKNGKNYQGPLIANESTNLEKEIIIFDCLLKKKEGPLRHGDGYNWSELHSKPCDGQFFTLTDNEMKTLRGGDPGFWAVSSNNYVYLSESEGAAIVVSTINFSDTNVVHYLQEAIAPAKLSSITNLQSPTVTYRINKFGKPSATVYGTGEGENKVRDLPFKLKSVDAVFDQLHDAGKVTT